MPYELEFIGIDKEAKDADAICFRYYDDSLGRYVIGIYDGGTSDYGEALKQHLLQYYFSTGTEQVIDYVICSHSDIDHAPGLSIILENFTVNRLIMNRPWKFIDELYEKVSDGRITKNSLEKRLRDAYPYIDNLEKLAIEKGVEILDAFAGTKISDKLTILSPRKQFYIELLVESNKTPLSENVQSKSIWEKITSGMKFALETWTNELLREDVSTTAENEMSVIVYGQMEEESFLLTGDAGTRALREAIDYSKTVGIVMADIKVHQIPHHGSRHNVSPSILNELVGQKVSKDSTPTKTAIVSVSKGSDHPRKMVVNAYIRRGCKVYEARNNIIRHYKDMPERAGWISATNLPFSENVEDWN